jgi:hypothetical protein
VLVGIGEGRAAWCLADTQVNKLAEAAGKAAADLPERIRSGQLAEQHRHQLVPAGEALGSSLRPVLPHQRSELDAREVVEKLTEETRDLYHSSALLTFVAPDQVLVKPILPRIPGGCFCLFHYVFKMALIQGQLVSCRVADLFAAIIDKPRSACSVAASRESKTRFAKWSLRSRFHICSAGFNSGE